MAEERRLAKLAQLKQKQMAMDQKRKYVDSLRVSLINNNVPFLYRVSQKKRNGGFSVHCELKVLFIFTSLDGASPAEENDALIIQFG